MLYGIIADIHSNLEALQTVLDQLEHADRIINVGDSVGYGASPNECIDLLRARGIPSVAGNHDKAATGELSTRSFNPNALAAMEWTVRQLSPASLDYLKALPLILEIDELEIVHGSLRDPLEEYITNIEEASATIEIAHQSICLVGHTHIPLYVGRKPSGSYDGRTMGKNDAVFCNNYTRTLINPGAVGQPRDKDPRASYGIYDSEKREFILHKAEYAVKAAQAKMSAAGLPRFLIERLVYGQ